MPYTNMTEQYTLMTALKNIKNKGIVYALNEDLVETAKRYPTITIAACITNRCVFGNETDLCGFTITPKGNLKHSDKELLYDGNWVKTKG